MDRSDTCITLIPAYNEEETIERVVQRALRYTDVCVIDDGSSDFTPEIVGRIEGIHVIHHRTNTHIPGCIRDGMCYALKQGYRYAITMDAGLSHNPDEIPQFLRHPGTDLLIGCRKVKYNTPLSRHVLSRIGNLVYNICLDFPRSLLGRRYRDMTSGFRRYSSRAMKLILEHDLESKSYDVMLETAHLICSNHYRIAEVDISYRYSSSSLNQRVIGNCLCLCIKILFKSLYVAMTRLFV
jgi:dolichol-phosphate mannosyltransferase